MCNNKKDIEDNCIPYTTFSRFSLSMFDVMAATESNLINFSPTQKRGPLIES